MSMGYDDDDPRREAMLRALHRGDWKLQPEQKPNTRRKSAMPDRLGPIGGSRS